MLMADKNEDKKPIEDVDKIQNSHNNGLVSPKQVKFDTAEPQEEELPIEKEGDMSPLSQLILKKKKLR